MKQIYTSGIIYCRVSSTEQVDGTSLDTQERLCRDYAHQHGITVAEVFTEPGESAKTLNRPQLTRALDFCRKRRIEVFIVYKLDRFSRNQYDHLTIRATLRRHGTVLRSATEPIDETSTGALMEGILSSFAQHDNQVRSERTLEGMQARVRDGVWVWAPPIGYRRSSSSSRLEPDPETAPFIRMLFSEYSKGSHTYKSIAHHLAERGFRTATGRRPEHTGIYRILTNGGN